MAVSPEWTEPILHLASLLRYQRRNREALLLFQKAVHLAPQSPLTLFNLAAFYHYELKRLKDAEAVYRRIIRHEPGNGVHYANLGSCLLDQGNRVEALKLAKQAIHLGHRRPHRVYFEFRHKL